MESSALIYLTLMAVTLFLALFVKRPFPVLSCAGERREAHRIRTRQDARNTAAEVAIYLLLTGVSACRIAVGNDYWVYRFNFNLIAQNRHVSSEYGFNAI
ncbi:MAG: hypothetical protein IKS07_03940, partial [Lachnospiraceae bacterium]|nr:hypothetical protein [Lachnospiraceae bacterium]